MTSADPTVTVIIVTHNSSQHLTDCLASVREASSGLRTDLIVVDNNSSDHSATIASRISPNAKIITNRTNLGFAAACNQGAEAARGKFLLFLNPDVMVDADSFHALIDVFSGNEPFGLIGARMRYPGGMFQPNCRRFPTLGNLIFSRGSALSFLGRFSSRQASRPYTLPDYNRVTIVDAIAGAMVMIERGLFMRIGRFDERFFMYMEDTDLCLRLHRSGYVNLFVPQAGGVHHWKQGSSAGQAGRILNHHRSTWRYFRKHSPQLTTTIPLAVFLAANMTLKLLGTLLRRRRS